MNICRCSGWPGLFPGWLQWCERCHFGPCLPSPPVYSLLHQVGRPFSIIFEKLWRSGKKSLKTGKRLMSPPHLQEELKEGSRKS